jgi:uncharacterized FlaG/YvyC family protein
MSNDQMRPISSSFSNISNVRIRYVVKDKVKTEVVDTKEDKVIREIPLNPASNKYWNMLV